MADQPFPDHMCVGSYGPHVTIPQAYVCGKGCLGENVQFDWDYAGVLQRGVKALQEACFGFPARDNTGNFDSNTQRVAKESDNFDLKAACEAMPGTTVFVQPDGKCIKWRSPATDLIKDDELNRHHHERKR